MARPASFDRGVLADLIRSGRYHSHAELAAVLSEVTGCAVQPNAVAVAMHRLKRDPQYADLPEFALRRETSLAAQLSRNTGRKLHPDYINHVYVQRLRQVSSLRLERPIPETVARLACTFEKDLRSKGYVVDLDSEGRPYCRPAYPHELDTAGYIVDIIALPSK